MCHTFAIYNKFRVVTVSSHEYCFVVYLFFGPFRFSINDFEQLHQVSPTRFISRSYSLCQSSSMGMLSRTVLVIPSVNRTNSIWLPGPSQCGFRVKTSLKADACESAWLYDCGMYRKDERGPLVECVEPMLRREKGAKSYSQLGGFRTNLGGFPADVSHCCNRITLEKAMRRPQYVSK